MPVYVSRGGSSFAGARERQVRLFVTYMDTATRIRLRLRVSIATFDLIHVPFSLFSEVHSFIHCAGAQNTADC